MLTEMFPRQELEVYVAKYSRNGLHGPCMCSFLPINPPMPDGTI